MNAKVESAVVEALQALLVANTRLVENMLSLLLSAAPSCAGEKLVDAQVRCRSAEIALRDAVDEPAKESKT